MGWDSVTNMVTGSDMAWAQAVAVSVIGKKRKGGPIEYMIDVIIEFTDMLRKRRSNKDSDSRKETIESASMGDRFSMDKVIAILNSIENVDDYMTSSYSLSRIFLNFHNLFYLDKNSTHKNQKHHPALNHDIHDLTALAIGNQPQNYHPNPCFVEEEEDLDIEQDGCDIKEDNEYVERVCLVDCDSSPIYDDYPEDFSQGEKIELDKNKVIYIRGEPITHIIGGTFDIQKQKVIDPFWEDFIEQELIEVNKRHERVILTCLVARVCDTEANDATGGILRCQDIEG
nr:hypothetical protein CFP56_69023 [Quercus suber]